MGAHAVVEAAAVSCGGVIVGLHYKKFEENYKFIALLTCHIINKHYFLTVQRSLVPSGTD